MHNETKIRKYVTWNGLVLNFKDVNQRFGIFSQFADCLLECWF